MTYIFTILLVVVSMFEDATFKVDHEIKSCRIFGENVLSISSTVFLVTLEDDKVDTSDMKHRTPYDARPSQPYKPEINGNMTPLRILKP